MKVLYTLIYITVIGQACFWAGLILPRDMFDENKLPYRLFKWERDGRVYDRLRIKKWKSKLPEMSTITKVIFPKKLKKDMTSADFDRLVKESCIAELSHYVLCIFSLGIYYIWEGKIGLLLTLLYSVFGNVTYIVIQRYNRPHFIAVRDKLKLREERRANASG